MASVLAGGAATGQPVAQIAARVLVLACAAALAFSLVVLARRQSYGLPTVAALMCAAFVALGAAEWVREVLRKPYVIGDYMFVNAVRLPLLPMAPPDGHPPDPHTVTAINETGVLKAAVWTRLPEGLDDADPVARAGAEGREVFRLLCSSCHTVDGYLAVRPLVRDTSPAAIDSMLARLAAPAEGHAWTDPHMPLRTWRSRRMPPFAGTDEERRSLAAYLAALGGTSAADVGAFLTAAPEGAEAGPAWAGQFYADNCAMCHAPDGPFPFDPKGRPADVFYDMLGRLPEVNDAMPPFEGTDAQRRSLAEHLTLLPSHQPNGGSR